MLERIHALREAAHALASTSPASGDSTAWQARQSLESALTAACDEAESIIKIMERGQVPDMLKCARLVACHIDAMFLLLQRVNSLGKQLQLQAERHQQEVTELRKELTELRKRLAELEADSDALLFRELAVQTLSKIARKADPDTSVWDACRLPLSVIKRTAVGADIMSRFPHIRDAIKTAKELARPIAHPVSTSAVTEDSLNELIQRSVPKAVRPGAGELLRCLVELASELREPLFVASDCPQ